jgi:hypothetical protein
LCGKLETSPTLWTTSGARRRNMEWWQMQLQTRLTTPAHTLSQPATHHFHRNWQRAQRPCRQQQQRALQYRQHHHHRWWRRLWEARYYRRARCARYCSAAAFQRILRWATERGTILASSISHKALPVGINQATSHGTFTGTRVMTTAETSQPTLTQQRFSGERQVAFFSCPTGL